jgi:ribonuclease VapC
MLIDTSVLLQILFDEPDAIEALGVILASPERLVTAPGLLETEIVFGACHSFADRAVPELVTRLNLWVEPFTAQHVSEARLAYERFGKGSGSEAKLNFGDCISYAVARTLAVPLAFKGDDFVHTDLDLVRTG